LLCQLLRLPSLRKNFRSRGCQRRMPLASSSSNRGTILAGGFICCAPSVKRGLARAAVGASVSSSAPLRMSGKLPPRRNWSFSILLSAHCHRPCLPFAYRWLASTGECQPLSATLPSVNGEHRGHDPAAEVAVCSMPRMPTSVSGRLLAAGNSAGLGALPTLPNSCDALAFANVLDFLHLSAVAADALANCYV
jgi:hypothetical protein